MYEFCKYILLIHLMMRKNIQIIGVQEKANYSAIKTHFENSKIFLSRIIFFCTRKYLQCLQKLRNFIFFLFKENLEELKFFRCALYKRGTHTAGLMRDMRNELGAHRHTWNSGLLRVHFSMSAKSNLDSDAQIYSTQANKWKIYFLLLFSILFHLHLM